MLSRTFAICLAALASLLVQACANTSFPAINRDKLLITLQRSACYGSCPDYKITIDGKGNVVFATRPLPTDEVAELHRSFSFNSGVRVAGTHRAKVSEQAVDDLVRQFRDANFFDLRNEYRASVTDSPTYVIAIDAGGKRKAVVDYVGIEAGMPKAVRSLEEAVDRAAGSERWINGTPEVIPLLQAEGETFKGLQGLALMDAAAGRGDLVTMERLRDLGAPIKGAERSSPLMSAIIEGRDDVVAWLLKNGAAAETSVLCQAIEQAASFDNHFAFQALSRSADQRCFSNVSASKILVQSGKNGDPTITVAMLAKGADPNWKPGPAEKPVLFEAANGISASGKKHSAADRRSTVQTLLKAGAKPLHCANEYCESALWGVRDPEIARMLVVAGADPNFKDNDGEHILFAIWDEDVALFLIKSGASLKATRPADGMKLRGWAKYQRWPKVLKLLDEAGL